MEYYLVVDRESVAMIVNEVPKIGDVIKSELTGDSYRVYEQSQDKKISFVVEENEE